MKVLTIKEHLLDNILANPCTEIDEIMTIENAMIDWWITK